MAIEQKSGSTFIKALKSLDEFLSSNGIKYCIIGGLAVQVHAEPRFTNDIDICVTASVENLDSIISLLLSKFPPLFPDAGDIAQKCLILPLKVEGVSVDIALGLSGFEAQVLERCSDVLLAQDLKIPICSAEDLVIYKCIAGRSKDLHDLRMIIERKRQDLDLNYIRETLQAFEEALAESGLVKLFEDNLVYNSSV